MRPVLISVILTLGLNQIRQLVYLTAWLGS